ncbi:flagellar assembly protein FliW [Sporosarcina limicola]|uniref:Flagellar assembly factor FliW n=1 Tax=Sporosarcina limicola TaxID=34101 RepID=A0A927MPJ1_9BACL|nr:flagellar assembly protein FliW [Sporosarcina limicola]MBE1555011.1 flagellar assembly factor FliW [Sporosarcina limicola]
MRIQTKFFGDVELYLDQRWTFPKGIPGFEDEKEFALLPIENNSTFQVLQSTTDRDIALIVANPYLLVENYSFDIDEPTIELLTIKEAEDIFVLAVLTLKDPFETSTINLQAPVIFQSKSKTAKQMLINDTAFSIRHTIGTQDTAIQGEA